ncbi:MAG TPA: hypothetical protein VIL51_06505 [Thermoleophilia bacterium]
MTDVVATDHLGAAERLRGGEALSPHPPARMEVSAIVMSTATPEIDARAMFFRRVVPAQWLFIGPPQLAAAESWTG